MNLLAARVDDLQTSPENAALLLPRHQAGSGCGGDLDGVASSDRSRATDMLTSASMHTHLGVRGVATPCSGPVRCRGTRSHWPPPKKQRRHPSAPQPDTAEPEARRSDTTIWLPRRRSHWKSALSTVTVSRDPRRDRNAHSSVQAWLSGWICENRHLRGYGQSGDCG